MCNMLRPVLYVAEKLKDVFTDNARYRTLDSTRNQFKVAYSGVETFKLNSGNSYNYTKTITHNFGYVPQVLCWGYSIKDAGSGTAGVDDRFSIFPFNDYVLKTSGTPNQLLVASIERTTSYVKLKVYEDDTEIYGADPQPAPYTLEDMKFMYLIFVDAEA